MRFVKLCIFVFLVMISSLCYAADIDLVYDWGNGLKTVTDMSKVQFISNKLVRFNASNIYLDKKQTVMYYAECNVETMQVRLISVGTYDLANKKLINSQTFREENWHKLEEMPHIRLTFHHIMANYGKYIAGKSSGVRQPTNEEAGYESTATHLKVVKRYEKPGKTLYMRKNTLQMVPDNSNYIANNITFVVDYFVRDNGDIFFYTAQFAKTVDKRGMYRIKYKHFEEKNWPDYDKWYEDYETEWNYVKDDIIENDVMRALDDVINNREIDINKIPLSNRVVKRTY